MSSHRSRRARGGFTLIEIMVVVVIIGILAALVITQIGGQSDKARADTTRGLLSTIGQQVDMFKLNHGRYPERLEDLMFRPSYIDPAKWKDAYLTRRPLDGWGNELLFRVPGTNAPYDIVSLGADAREGGTGYDEDIWNHELYKGR